MKLLKRLRASLTVINAVVSGIILLAMALGALLFTQKYFSGSNENAFAHAADSVVYYVQYEAVVRHSYLSRIELTQELIIHIEDGGNPFQWPGVVKTGTPREILFDRAWTEAKNHGVDIKKRAFSPENYTTRIYGNSNDEYRVSIWLLPGEDSWHSITILRDMHGETKTFRNLAFIFMGFALLGLAILGFFSYGFAGRAIKPVEAAQNQQNQFVQAASHELRTPVAVIQSSSEALLKADAHEADKFAKTIVQQCRHLSKLVEDLLLLAGSDTGALKMNFAPVELHTVLQEAAGDFSLLFTEKNIELSFHIAEPSLVWGDPVRIRQVLHILLDNALEHTPGGGDVRLELQKSGNEATIKVKDTGTGIPDEHKAHIFDRFYRADKSRSRAKAHYGLGLSIAKEIMLQHGGKISLSDNEGGGAVLVLHFPIESSD